MYTFEDKLKEYADLLVRVGVNVQKGQDLVITSQVDQAPFARLCVEAAYKAGARPFSCNNGGFITCRLWLIRSINSFICRNEGCNGNRLWRYHRPVFQPVNIRSL